MGTTAGSSAGSAGKIGFLGFLETVQHFICTCKPKIGTVPHFCSLDKRKCRTVPIFWSPGKQKIGTVQHFCSLDRRKCCTVPISWVSGMPYSHFADTHIAIRTKSVTPETNHQILVVHFWHLHVHIDATKTSETIVSTGKPSVFAAFYASACITKSIYMA